jgi:TatA/E family protein of Tat protein translocase
VFGSLGITEIAVIMVLALLLFGPKRLPEIGRTIGKGMAEFRRATNDLKRTFESEMAIDETPVRRPPPATPIQALPAPVVARMGVAPAAPPAGETPATVAEAASAAPAAPAPGRDAPSDPSPTA